MRVCVNQPLLLSTWGRLGKEQQASGWIHSWRLERQPVFTQSPLTQTGTSFPDYVHTGKQGSNGSPEKGKLLTSSVKHMCVSIIRAGNGSRKGLFGGEDVNQLGKKGRTWSWGIWTRDNDVHVCECMYIYVNIYVCILHIALCKYTYIHHM